MLGAFVFKLICHAETKLFFTSKCRLYKLQNHPSISLFRNLAIGLVFYAVSSVSLFSQDSDFSKMASQIKTNTNGVFLCVKSKALTANINAALNDRRLVGYNPLVFEFDDTPASLERTGRELSWLSTQSWAFYYMGQTVASGTSAPSVDELQNAFTRGNVPNRVALLRNFLAWNPTNLDARLALMQELHGYAYQKTARALNITPRDSRSDPFSAMHGTTIAPDMKEDLQPEADLNIWGDLAVLLDAAFSTEDWLFMLPDFFSIGRPENMTVHSPAMKAIFMRNMPRVERALKNRQVDSNLWRMWQVMAQAVERRILDFFPQIADLPGESGYAWPPISVTEWMTQEAKVTNNWSKIIELKWPGWPNLQSSLNMFAPINNRLSINPEILSMQKNYYWTQQILPLFEACLQNKDFAKANEIYFDISLRPLFEREAKLVFDMAKSHKYEFPRTYEPTRRAPEIEMESFIGDPTVGDSIRVRPRINKLKDLIAYKAGGIRLIVIDPSAMSDENRLQSILSQGRLPEHAISPYIMKPDQPVAIELIEQEGLPSNTFSWGILNDDAKYHHGGNSIPAPDNIKNLLDSMNRKTRLDIFREFVKDNPESITAKMLLLMESERVGNTRTHNAKKDFNNYLDESLDFEIWGEFVNISNSIFSDMLQRPDSMYSLLRSHRLYSQEATIKNSRLLQQFITRNIGSIENTLQDRPHARHLWELWGAFSPYAPNRSLPSFLATLTPVPDLPDFPPVFLYPDLIKSYKSLEDWRPIIALLEPIWESYGKMIEAEENVKHRLTKELLKQYINPLCEAYNKIGQEQKAEKIRSDWKKAEGWRQS